jgi:hypothetical protein
VLKRWILYVASVVLGLGVVGALLGAFVLALLWPSSARCSAPSSWPCCGRPFRLWT